MLLRRGPLTDSLGELGQNEKIASAQIRGASDPRKGNRIERELVELHRAFGIHAERYSLPGANRGHNIDIYPFGREEAPLVFEVKAQKK